MEQKIWKALSKLHPEYHWHVKFDSSLTAFYINADCIREVAIPEYCFYRNFNDAIKITLWMIGF